MYKFSTEYLKELEAEAAATRKCLERITPELFGWKPHSKSMTMGYLALLVAGIPKWISDMITKTVIDLSKSDNREPESTGELVKYFDDNMNSAREALKNVKEESLSATFKLVNNEQVLFSAPIGETIGSTLNHWVHHRGQLTVYMRLNEIPVPSIYGPSADDKTF